MTFDFGKWCEVANIAWSGSQGSTDALTLREDDELILSPVSDGMESGLFNDRDDHEKYAAVIIRRSDGSEIPVSAPLRYFGRTGGEQSMGTLRDRVLHELGVTDVFPPPNPALEYSPNGSGGWLDALEHLRDAESEVSLALFAIENTLRAGHRPYGGQLWNLMSYCARFGYAVRSAELSEYEPVAARGGKDLADKRSGADQTNAKQKAAKDRRVAHVVDHARRLLATEQPPPTGWTAPKLAELVSELWMPFEDGSDKISVTTITKYIKAASLTDQANR